MLGLVLLWSAVAVLVYQYVGYPLLLAGLAALRGPFPRRRFADDAELPVVSLLISAYNEEEVEGSSELAMLSITAGYEGTYADLLHFLHELDRANRLVIIESLAASPQQGSGVLNITLRLNTFIREAQPQNLAAVTVPDGGRP